MNWNVFVVGKPGLGFAKDGVAEYVKRLSRYGGCQVISVKRGSSEEESKRLLEASEGMYRVALDERGRELGTMEFSEKMQAIREDNIREVAFLVGGANGHDESLRKHVDMVLRFGRMTLQHELALLILVEQLYRVETIWRGMPYHREG